MRESNQGTIHTVFQSLTYTVRQKGCVLKNTEKFFGERAPRDDGGAAPTLALRAQFFHVPLHSSSCEIARINQTDSCRLLKDRLCRPGQHETSRLCRRRARLAAETGRRHSSHLESGVISHSEFCPHWPHYLRAPCGQPQPRLGSSAFCTPDV